MHIIDTPAPPVEEIERQIAWENHSITEGVRRYRRSVAESSLADTSPGVTASREMMSALIPAIEELQRDAADALINSRRGRQPDWWWTVGLLPADKLAFITVNVVLTDRVRGAHREGRPMSGLAIAVGAAVKTQVEFEGWKASEKERAAGDPDETDYYKMLTARASGRVDLKTFARWRKKLDRIRRLHWTRPRKLHLGARLLDLAIQHGGGWFEYRMVRHRQKTERQIFLSDVARVAISDIHDRLELNRPLLLPMKCPPKMWRRVDDV